MRLRVAVVIVALVLATPAVASATSPITPANRPTPLVNAVNGEVPMTRLVNVARNCIAAREAGPSLARLFALARLSRVGLAADQCYRPLVQQVDFAHQAQQPGNNPACVATVGQTSSGKPVGHSYHGWGKAVDLTDGVNSLTFASPGYAFMKYAAGSLGWNHPAFAEPGGSTCPEPWHWEWVGDGGILGRSPVRGDVVGLLPSRDDGGYATVTGLGGIGAHGDFVSHGGAGKIPIAWVMVGAAPTTNRAGYWMAGGDGGVFSFGNARFFGSTARLHLAQPVNGIMPTRSGNGYWLLAWDGGVFSFGDARFFGSTGGMRLHSPVVAMVRTASGNGYWLVAGDGGVFSFGDAKFFGSLGGRALAAPVVAMARTRTGNGYWLLGANGKVYPFGDAKSFGSVPDTASPSVSILPTKTGNGYWVARADARVYAFGDAHSYGSG